MHFDAYYQLLKGNQLTLSDIKVLETLLQHLNYGNRVNKSQKELAATINMHKQHFSASISKLQKLGVLTKTGNTQNQKIVIASIFVWRGKLNQPKS